MIFEISEDMKGYSNVNLIAELTWKVEYANELVEFDGGITVRIEKPPVTQIDGYTTKWVMPWGENPDRESIEGQSILWGVGVYGGYGAGAQSIVGTTITDTLANTDAHHYTEEDMEKGIRIYASYYGAHKPGEEYTPNPSYSWVVNPGDPGLTWTEDGWSYVMPATVPGSDPALPVGDEGWYYNINYTSTVKTSAGEKEAVYQNTIEKDGQKVPAQIVSSIVKGSVGKTGAYNPGTDVGTDDDTFDWTITATIPGAKAGQKLRYGWSLWDQWSLPNAEDGAKYMSSLGNFSVTAKIGGKDYTIPQMDNAEGDDLICWICNTLTQEQEGHYIALRCRCQCTEENCQWWDEPGQTWERPCKDKSKRGDFCECWSLTEDAEITFTFSTPAGELVDKYGGRGARLKNNVYLSYYRMDGGQSVSYTVDRDEEQVTIPGVFTKKQTDEPTEANSYLAEYTITFNEARENLSSFQELTITDTMSKTLSFVPSTLSIQSDDGNGASRMLAQGTDYTLSYQTQADSNVLTITLNKPALGACKYTLVYKASVGGTGGLEYSNTATVILSGKTYTVNSAIHSVPAAAITAETYNLKLYKCEQGSEGTPLSGAVFGLFTQDGSQLSQYATDEHGAVTITTDASSGVIFHEHTIYAVQELTPPPGYVLDSTKRYFWFCNGIGGCANGCAHAGSMTNPYANVTCIRSGNTNPGVPDLTIENEKTPPGYELPSTGGFGTASYAIEGLATLCMGVLLLRGRTKMKRWRRR